MTEQRPSKRKLQRRKVESGWGGEGYEISDDDDGDFYDVEDVDREIERLRKIEAAWDGIFGERDPENAAKWVADLLWNQRPAHEPSADDIRQLFNGAVGVQKENRFGFSFETEEEANRAFHYIASLGALETSQPPVDPLQTETRARHAQPPGDGG